MFVFVPLLSLLILRVFVVGFGDDILFFLCFVYTYFSI